MKLYQYFFPTFEKTNLDNIFISRRNTTWRKIINENEPGFLQIDRETLNVTIHDEAVDDEYLFNGENCLVYNNETIRTNMIKMKQKLIDERSKDN